VHQGPAGAGQHTKMVNQILIATNMIGVCEALLYGYRAGLDLNTVLESIAPGAAGRRPVLPGEAGTGSRGGALEVAGSISAAS